MTDPKRMKQLNDAWEMIEKSSPEEKEELFKYYYQKFEALKSRLDSPNNRLEPHWIHASSAIDSLDIFFTRLTGYSASWIPDYYLKYYPQNTGRPEKYSRDTRADNCFFITHMVERGASETQAMKLLMRLRGDKAMSSGHLRELQDTYRDYKKIEGLREGDLSILRNGHAIVEFLRFSISNLEGDEVASQKAVAAFRSFLQELIDLMKSSHRAIAKYDRSYPEIFGCVIDWINSEYVDPLDYFYTHESHESVPLWNRRRGLMEYINTIGAYKDMGRIKTGVE